MSEDIDKVLPTLGCGLHRIPITDFLSVKDSSEYYCFEPVIRELLDQIGNPKGEGLVMDLKIHMLMPKQYPCIPNWHCDLVPRDENGERDFSKVETEKPIYLWVSGAPLTQIMLFDGITYSITPKKWLEIDQLTIHRGRPSEEHCWRAFIRVAHESIMPPNPPDKVNRRHSQVYLDADSFEW